MLQPSTRAPEPPTSPLMPTTSPTMSSTRAVVATPEFVFIGDRLWLDFVNSDDSRRASTSADVVRRVDALRDFDLFIDWLHSAAVLDVERAAGMRRRAIQQPAGAAAALVDARRVRSALRTLAERGLQSGKARADALDEINRIHGRSAGTRRVEARADGSYARTFVTVGDAFAGLMIAVVDSAADSLIAGELARVHRCSDPRCPHVFIDTTKNGRRRWCDMATCGNRAKAARHRRRARDAGGGLTLGS